MNKDDNDKVNKTFDLIVTILEKSLDPKIIDQLVKEHGPKWFQAIITDRLMRKFKNKINFLAEVICKDEDTCKFCSSCNGKGYITDGDTFSCPTCKGTGDSNE